MHSAISDMLKKYRIKSIDDKKNALKEIVQEISLLGLYRSGFYHYAAFYGGTALRIFYGLDRFSEDLDFSLLERDSDFELEKHIKYIKEELSAYGFEMTVEEKVKESHNNIKSAFIRGNTEIHLLKIFPATNLISGLNKNDVLKIKLEVDINPPQGAEYDVKYHLNPIPFSVRVFKESCLFAGKVHALLCRKWGNRVKGRDFYDFVWYLSRNSKLNLKHLQNRMIFSGHLNPESKFDKNDLINLMIHRFNDIDFTQAKEDVRPFIKDLASLDIWSKEFFTAITEDKLLIQE